MSKRLGRQFVLSLCTRHCLWHFLSISPFRYIYLCKIKTNECEITNWCDFFDKVNMLRNIDTLYKKEQLNKQKLRTTFLLIGNNPSKLKMATIHVSYVVYLTISAITTHLEFKIKQEGLKTMNILACLVLVCFALRFVIVMFGMFVGTTVKKHVSILFIAL